MKRTASRTPDALTPFESCTLTALPCGCVVGDFRAELMDVELVSIEAKGPHCLRSSHVAGGVLGLGECGELDTRQIDALVESQPAA